jgi:FkbM family methyltransferase
MYIEFKDICDKYGTPRGVIHIGAHIAEERDNYITAGVEDIIWIEGNPDLVKNLLHLNSYSEKVIECLVSDKNTDSTTFNITNNGQSSSILNLDKHLIHHPWVQVEKVLNLPTRRMDSIIEENQIDMSKFNFLNLDIQGCELFAIKGFDKYINFFDFIFTEVNIYHLYENCPLITDIDQYLSNFGFERKETYITEWQWGDALYVKTK